MKKLIAVSLIMASMVLVGGFLLSLRRKIPELMRSRRS